MKKNFKFILFIFLFLNLLFLKNSSNAQLFGSPRPLLVEISTQWCHACQILKPTLEELKSKYSSNIEFVLLDLTNEETTAQAYLIAANYGLVDYLKTHSYAFPTVGILCSSTTNPDKLIIGANEKSVYEDTLDSILLAGGYCSFSENEAIASATPKPKESENTNIENSSGRPVEFAGSGRPIEFKFYKIDEPIPISAYFTALPECANGLNVICSNNFIFNTNKTTTTSDEPIIFKPYDPNFTRDEKGYNTITTKKKGKGK